jgi:S-adenosylhomocysteine hydrolase
MNFHGCSLAKCRGLSNIRQWLKWALLRHTNPKSVAKLKLESMGIKIDRLTPEQEEYLAGWSEGT